MVRVLRIDPDAPDEGVIAEAARILGDGGLVAFPTETVYGLGARGLHRNDVGRIFAAKRRPLGHPLILHVDGESMAKRLASAWPASASRLAAELWPGPLTLVVPRAPLVPDEVTGGLPTVALRAPNHAVALALIRAVGEPLAAPSANAHTHVSPTTAMHVVRSLGDGVDLVLDAGPCAYGIESTVLSLDDPPRVLRPGAVSLARLRTLLPHVDYATAVVLGEAPRASPGMASRHYAPRARVAMVPRETVDAAIESIAAAAANDGTRIAAIVATPRGRRAAESCSLAVALPDEPEGYAHGLFAALYEVDEAGADLVVIEEVPAADPTWWAVADRLARAARRQ